MSFDYKSSLITKYRKGTSVDPFISITESKQVKYGKVVLNEIPNKRERVHIDGYVEFTTNKPLTPDGFRVDYDAAVVFFSDGAEGENVTIHYLGEGSHFLSASRVWTKEKNGNVEETLQDIVDKIGDVDRAIDDADQAADNANAAMTNANQARDDIIAIKDSFKFDIEDYFSEKQYNVNNQVHFNGSTYICIQDSLDNYPTHTDYWRLFATKGENGEGTIQEVVSSNNEIEIGGTPLVPDLRLSKSIKDEIYNHGERIHKSETSFVPDNRFRIKYNAGTGSIDIEVD